MTTTLNPSDKGASQVLSNGNLTITGSAAGFNAGMARTVNSFSTGKYYFEAKYDLTAGAQNSGIGISNATEPNTNQVASTANSVAVYDNDNRLWTNSVAGAQILTGLPVLNDVMQWCVDATNRLIWVRLNNTGNWNNSGTANPATGVGGVSISAVTGALFAAISADTNADKITARFSAASWGFSPPSGFGEINPSSSPFTYAKRRVYLRR